MSQDFYGLLGIPRSATKEQIRHAYLGLARKYHPDTNQGTETDEQLKEVNHAYEILSDDESRTEYNLALRENDPLEFTTKLYSLKSVATACAVTAVLVGTLSYGLTLIQPKPEPVFVMVPSPSSKAPPDQAAIEKTLETLDKSKDVPSLQISSVPSLKKQKIPITDLMTEKRPLGFEPKNLAYSSSTELRAVKNLRSAPVKRAKKTSALNARRSTAEVAKTDRGSLNVNVLASKPKPIESPAIRVGSSPEAILSTILIPMEDGSSVPADTLLKVDPNVWKWNRGGYRKKLAKFISALIESKNVARASQQSGLSLGEIRYLVQQV